MSDHKIGDSQMQLLTETAPRQMPRFSLCVGDTETGIVHAAQSNCVVDERETFLDVRTALVRGYHLCSACFPR